MANLHGSPRSDKQIAAFNKLIQTLLNKTPKQKAAIARKKIATRKKNDAKAIVSYLD